MSNRKSPSPSPEWGIFCFLPPSSLFPVSCVCPVLAGIPAITSSLFLSVFLSIYLRPFFRPFLRPFLRHCMPASFVCSFRRIISGFFRLVSGFFRLISVLCLLRRMSSRVSLSLSFFFAVYLRCYSFFCCLSAIFSIYMYFLYFFSFLFAHIKNSSYLCTVFLKGLT